MQKQRDNESKADKDSKTDYVRYTSFVSFEKIKTSSSDSILIRKKK